MKLSLQKPTQRQVKNFFKHVAWLLLGNILVAAGPGLFIIPAGFSMAGTAGLGIFVRTILPETIAWREWAVNISVYAINISLFIVGAILLGKKFAIATLAGTILYPTFLSLYQILIQMYRDANGGNLIVSNPTLAVVLGAMLYGAGGAIIFREGACAGGTDIPPLLAKKYLNIPLAVSMWVSDVLIIMMQVVALQVTGGAIENALWGIVIAIISAVVINLISPIGVKKTQVKIISKKYREIREMIINNLNRGVTDLFGQTGYLKEKTHVLLTVVSNRELVRLKDAVHKIDPEAFMMVSVISEVRGRGFSSEGIRLPKEAEVVEDLVEEPSMESGK